MMRVKFPGVTALMVALLAAAAVRAAEPAVPQQAYVLLVGIDQYADDHVLAHPHAEADARALYDVFTSPDRLGVDDKHIRLLLGKPDKKRPSQPATRDNILQALKWLQTKPGKNDLLILGFIGQGAPVGKRLCFFAADSTFKERKKNAIASGDIEQALGKLKTQPLVAFVDVNFLGYKDAKKLKLDPDINDLYQMFLGKDETKETKEVHPRRAVFVTDPVKPALQLKNHTLFMQVLLDGLKGQADKEGYEPDGVVTVVELAKYFKKQFPERARSVGKTDDEKKRSAGIWPFFTVEEGKINDFVLVRNPAAYPKAHARVVGFDKLVKANGFSKEIADEGDTLLGRMPKLEAKQTLRKAYQKLADGTLDKAEFLAERKTILAGMLLPEQEAKTYAKTVLDAAREVRRGFFKPVNEGDLIDYGIRGLYRDLNEKIPVAIRERLQKVKEMKEPELRKLLIDARSQLGKREDLAKGKDITLTLHPMLHKLDKHTDYIDPDTVRKFSQDIEGHFDGIGVQIKKNEIRDQLQVVTPIRNTPAYRAGLWEGDIITKIVREVDNDGTPLDSPEILPTKGMTTDQAVKKIIGKAGTKVKLIVEREGEAKPLVFDLIRGRVEVETVLGNKRKADDSWDYVIDPENKICYIRLTQFSHNTYYDLERVMKQLNKKGIKGFILDLRFNPGGLLDGAVKISDLFIDDGMIVTIRPRSGPETSYVGLSTGSYTAFPMVCLVNGFSASASEIVSACLQDHTRAIVIGSRTYGKGSVQTIHPFDTGGRLKLTTATYWRPSGRNINKSSTPGREGDEWGVKPNRGFTLDLSVKDLNDLQDHQRDREIIHRPDKRKTEKTSDFHDRQLEMALEYLRGQIKIASKASTKKAG